MSDYSQCTPDRISEIRELLDGKQLDFAVRSLTKAAQKAPMSINWDRVGIELCVTSKQAIIQVSDPTPDVMDAVAGSGRSFTAIY